MKNLIRKGCILAFTTTLALSLATTISAQQATPTPPGDSTIPASETAEAERVMVTGSLIPTAAEVGPNPVQVITRKVIEASGERTAEQLIKNLPIANANGVPIANNAQGTAQGASSISLRGFDPGATLVLIDGHRVTPFPTGTADGSQMFIDLNSIPKAAIEGIEILKDGASTTYGADAVAGVINIKLRHNYTDTEVSVEAGNTTNKDSTEFASSLVFGLGSENTNVTGVLNYYHRNSIFNRDRSYSEIQKSLSTNASPFNLELSRAAVLAAGGNPPPELGDTFFGHAPFLSTGSAPALAYTYSEGRSAFFTPSLFSGALPDSQRYGGYVNAQHKVFDDQMIVYADLMFQHVDTHNELASANTNDFATPFLPAIAIPPHSPGAVLGGPTHEETGVPAGAYNPFNPFQQIISSGSRGRLFEFGNRKFDSEVDAFFTTAGIRGDKLFGGAWGYDAAFRYSQILNATVFASPSVRRFDRILNAADPIFNPSSSQYIGTTIPYNPFGDYRRPIASNYRFTDFVLLHEREQDRGSATTVELNIYTTDLYHLPAGGLGLAFGGQFQYETNSQEPTARQISGDLVGIGNFVPVDGSRSEYAGYAEANIPVFGSTFSAPGFHVLEFTAAVRYEEFLNNGSNVMVPKFGMRWQPFDDSLTLRATWGEGFKQPSLVNIAIGGYTSFLQDIRDPVTGNTVEEVATTLVSNPNLQPEDSRSFSGGVVYTPKFLPGLTVTVDLFDIETTGWINPNPNPEDVLARVAAGNPLPGESVTRDTNGNLLALTLSYQNSGTQKARGADFSLQYQIQTSFGTFTSITQATFLDSFQFSSVPGAKEKELRSRPTDFFSDDAYLKWKATSRLDWSWRRLEASATANYRDGYHEFDLKGREHWVRQTWFFDLQTSYDFTSISRSLTRPLWKQVLDGTRISVGCTNVFDHDPPDSSSLPNYPRFIYEPTGRFVYLSLTKKF